MNLIPPGTTATVSAQSFTPGPDPVTLYLIPAVGVAQTTSSNVMFIERLRSDGGWQTALVLNGEANGDGILLVGKGTFRGRRPLQGDATGLDLEGTVTLS